MKVAVYTISLDEAHNVAEWAESAKDADLILLADTGSTDGTQDLARAAGVQVIDVRVDPWRFDVARNASLAALPLDLDWCIALDLDERLQPGWREALEKVSDDVDQVYFWYTCYWHEDGCPELQFWRDRCHRRSGFFWKHTVHEEPTYYGPHERVHATRLSEFVVLQYPDLEKERDDKYVNLLRMETREEPKSVFAWTWLAWTLRLVERPEEAVAAYEHALSLAPGDEDIAAELEVTRSMLQGTTVG